MFNNIHCLPYASAETTTALVDGEEVRYLIAFHAANDGQVCVVSCAVIHAGSSGSVGFSIIDHR